MINILRITGNVHGYIEIPVDQVVLLENESFAYPSFRKGTGVIRAILPYIRTYKII